jgi:hypothetical protein
MTKTMKMGKGIERVAFMTAPRTRYSVLLSRICPVLVMTIRIPKGTPKREVRRVEREIM